jgi:ribonucleoside-triphosphate reductase
MNEACLNAKWIKEDLTEEKAQKWTKEVLNFMREKLSDYQEEYGDLYNLEATPAESTSYRMAKKDKSLYPDIITASDDDTPYYTNSSHLPVGYTDDIFKALDIQDELQTLYTSGTVFHAFMGERLENWKAAANLVRKIAENYKLPYYTMSPTYSVCRNHGYIRGEVWKCPDCGEETEVYSRITGYYRPVKNWNDGKAKEYQMRKEYDINAHHECTCKKAKEEVKEEKCEEKDGIILFGTKTCPNCTSAKKLLDKAKVKYTFVDAEEEVDMTKKFGVKQAPTLVEIKKGKVNVVPNLSNIKKFAEEKKK